MKRKTVKRIKKYLVFVISLLILVAVFSNSSLFYKPVKVFADIFSGSAVKFVLPSFLNNSQNSDISAFNDNKTKSKEREKTTLSLTEKQSISTTKNNATTKKTDEKTVLTNAEEYGGRVKSQTINKAGATASYGDVYVKNKTEKTINIKTEMSKKPNLKIKLNSSKPQVLIVHTHATESFFPSLVENYPKSWGERDNDVEKNMVSVGSVIKNYLDNAGIKTVQSTVLHDKGEYNGAYDRSRKTIISYLKKYPSIKVVLDVHRDAINEEDGDKIRPIINIKGKTAGQIMLVSGCESGPITGYPNWRKNLRFSLGLQKTLEQNYPSLARPLFFAEKKYNQDLCENSLLVEVGSQANLLSEAKYSAKLFAISLSKYLKSFSN